MKNERGVCIEIKEKTREKLKKAKKDPRESYDSVIVRALKRLGIRKRIGW